MRLLIGVLVIATALVTPAPARAGSFLDPDARLFTLLWSGDTTYRDGGVGRVRALRDGSVVYTRGITESEPEPRLWRLWPDGREEPIDWVGALAGNTVAPDGTLLGVRVNGTAIERFDLDRRRRSVVADLAGTPGLRPNAVQAVSLAALDDGSIVFTNRTRVWKVSRAGDVKRIRGLLADVSALVGLPGGRFAAVEGPGWISIVDARANVRRLDVEGFGGITATSDGRLLWTTYAEFQGPAALTLIDPRGGTTRLESTPAHGFAQGDGGTLAQAPWVPPTSMAIAADGSLVFATGDRRIRALVPADSVRPRIALALPTLGGFEQGRVTYHAGGPGTLHLEVFRDGQGVGGARGSTAGGDGELAITPPGPGVYDLRLRLQTPAGIVRTARGRVDNRTTLSIEDARLSILAAVTDNGNPGRCTQLSPVSVQCTMLPIPDRGDAPAVVAPYALARATLGADRATRVELTPITPAIPSLDLATRPLRMSAGAIGGLRVTPSAAGRVTVWIQILRPSGGRRMSLEEARNVAAGQAWDARLRLSPRRARTLRHWLASGARVFAYVQVKLETPDDVTLTRWVDRRVK